MSTHHQWIGSPRDRILATKVDDASGLYRYWLPGQYDPSCSCCWLGFSHTKALHDALAGGQ